MTIPTNPYIAGDPVGKTSCFIGRDDVLLAVENLLRHSTENAITLHGQRRIGKTSILQYLAMHLQNTGPYHPIYFDLMYMADAPLAEILRELARKITLELDLPNDYIKDITEEVFQNTFLPKVIHFLPDQDSLVLLLDEFDVLADPQSEKEIKRQFFGYLSKLRQLDPKHLKFIFVLGRNVDDLDVMAGLLFKDIRFHRITLLSENEIQELVSLAQQNGSLHWRTEAITRIWELTSGHPYLTQALCSQIWDDAHYNIADEAPVVSLDLVEKAIEGTLNRSQHMFSWVWNGLGPAEKIVASALALACEGKKTLNEEQLQGILEKSGVSYIGVELPKAPQILKNWDILVPVDSGFRFSVELFRRWIVDNQPLSRTLDELDRINPLANKLYGVADEYYQDKNIEEADRFLKQALGLNPNHPHANELYAEILLDKENFEEAQVFFERLDQIVPGKARLRLKKIYLIRARTSVDEVEKIKWYEEILIKIPDDPEAQDGKKKIYQAKGERSLQNRDYNAAITAFHEVGDNEGERKAIELRDYEHQLEILAAIDSYETAGNIVEAYQLIQELAQKHPDDENIRRRLENLEGKLAILEKQKQIAALHLRQPALVNYLYQKAVTIDPFYENTSHYPSPSDTDNFKTQE